MKNLYFVTFHPTDTQFVVEQDNETLLHLLLRTVFM